MAIQNEKVDPSLFNEKIIKVNIAKQTEEWQKIFGANKNLYRYFQSLVDGLKPVERRFLYTLYTLGRYKDKEIKLSRAAGDTMNYHPHGDASIAEVGIGMAQDWVENMPLIYTDGNEGSIKGDKHAAPRYLDVRLSDFAYDCYFKDFKDSAVDMVPAYTGEGEEPLVLPAKYPVALINGGFSSIGYGFSSNISPFNFKEVCEAIIKLVKNPDAKIVLYPDLPTGADLIMTKKEAKTIFEKAEHEVKIKMRATPEIDYINNTITFTSIPMQTSTNKIVADVNNLRLQGQFDEIDEIRDITTDATGVLMEFVLKSEVKGQPVNPDKVLEKLYKLRTDLRSTKACSIILIDDFTANQYSVRDFLLSWIDYRRDTVRASINTKLANLVEAQHINDIKVFLCKAKNIEKTMEISKKSKNVDDYKDNLMKAYGITSLQAKVIAAMPTSAFNEDSRKSFVKDSEAMEEEIKRLMKVQDSDSKIDDIIIDEMEEGIKKYGQPRKSAIINDENEIVDNACIVGITDDGYIKKVLKSGKVIGAVSKKSSAMMMAFAVNDSDSIILFDDRGSKHLIRASQIPLLKEKDAGLKIGKFIEIEPDARVISASIIGRNSTELDNYEFLFVTARGIAKRTTAPLLIKSKDALVGSSKVILLNEGDRLELAMMINPADTEHIIIFTDYGDGINLNIEDIPKQSVSSKGAKIMTLRPSEKVLGVDLIQTTDKYLVYTTSNGKVKKTELKYFPVMNKKDEPLCLTGLDDGEYLVSVVSVKGDETLTFYKKKSTPVSIKVKEIPIKTRAAKAEKMIKMTKTDCILSVSVNK